VIFEKRTFVKDYNFFLVVHRDTDTGTNRK